MIEHLPSSNSTYFSFISVFLTSAADLSEVGLRGDITVSCAGPPTCCRINTGGSWGERQQCQHFPTLWVDSDVHCIFHCSLVNVLMLMCSFRERLNEIGKKAPGLDLLSVINCNCEYWQIDSRPHRHHYHQVSSLLRWEKKAGAASLEQMAAMFPSKCAWQCADTIICLSGQKDIVTHERSIRGRRSFANEG